MERLLIGDQSQVWVDAGLAADPQLELDPLPEQALVVTQPGAEGHASLFADALAAAGIRPTTHVLPDGEEAKTLDVVRSAYAVCLQLQLTRRDLVVGVGGGTVTDVAGFVAATYLRGLRWVAVPTTLLGAVDAAIGGKTGVNFGGKNLVGAFHHPTLVLVDITVLAGLPPNLLSTGMAEALKAGLVGDPELVILLEEHGLAAPLEDVVVRAAAVKCRVVGEDFEERGVRAVLNYGHTVGHAVEVVTGLSHGEAIAIGMTAAADIAAEMLGFEDLVRQQQAIVKLDLPTRGRFDRDAVLELVELDKKKDAGGIRMVLLESIGRPQVVPVEAATLARAVEAVGTPP